MIWIGFGWSWERFFRSLAHATRPFTAVVSNAAGAYAGTIVAQGNNYHAGAGGHEQLQRGVHGALNVPAVGAFTFTFVSDDAFVFSVGGGATRVSGPQLVGGNNRRTAPAASAITVNFPEPGVYPYEVDFAKGADAKLALTPLQPAPQLAGRAQMFTAMEAGDACAGAMPGSRRIGELFGRLRRAEPLQPHFRE